MASRKIRDLLGDFDFAEFASKCAHGNGVTKTIKFGEHYVCNKMTENPLSISSLAANIYAAVISQDLNLSSVYDKSPFLAENYSCTNSGRLAFVPKNAKTDRTILIEPTGNIFLQKGIGKMIRKRLLRASIDLDSQEENQRFAKLAYSHGYATIDFKAASDSISIAIVKELLPPDWLELLEVCRSSQYSIKGREFTFNKWSSMGNGYTFELESLIFWGLACATIEYAQFEAGMKKPYQVRVYGDDVIMPSDYVPLFNEVCQFCGFTINLEKSFSEGNFYESCGKHYFEGCDVTPIYQKEQITDISSLIRLHNRIYRWFDRQGTICFASKILSYLRDFLYVPYIGQYYYNLNTETEEDYALIIDPIFDQRKLKNFGYNSDLQRSRLLKYEPINYHFYWVNEVVRYAISLRNSFDDDTKVSVPLEFRPKVYYPLRAYGYSDVVIDDLKEFLLQLTWQSLTQAMSFSTPIKTFFIEASSTDGGRSICRGVLVGLR